MDRGGGSYYSLPCTGAPLPEIQTRAGTYQRQPAGYRAFGPAPLPPRPNVKLTGHLHRLFDEQDPDEGEAS